MVFKMDKAYNYNKTRRLAMIPQDIKKLIYKLSRGSINYIADTPTIK